MHTTLDPYKDQFRSVVLAHINEKLGNAEWARLRAFASDPRRYVDKSQTADLNATAEALFDAGYSVDSVSVQDTLIPAFKVHAEKIGVIEEQPVYYIRSQGIYFWGLDPVNWVTLMFWATHPAYPPSW